MTGMRRRTALALSAAALGGAPRDAAAQVLGVPLPCLVRAGDVVAVVLEGTGAPAGTVTVFGQAFRPGDLPRGAALLARGADGREVTAQLDVVSRHTDGSARLGVVALATPVAIPVGRRHGVVLSMGPTRSVPALDLAAALAGRAAVLELAGNGTPWRVDLLAALRSASAPPWQAGPLAAHARVMLPVPPAAVGGVASMRLVADIAARADGTLWVEAWLRNDVAMRPGGGAAAYSVRILLDGREVLRSGPLRQPQYTGWGRLIGARRGGAAPEPPRVRHDAAYLADSGAVARYDLSTGVAEPLLARFGAATAAPAWAIPLSPRGITQQMPATGGRADIGPATQVQAAWLMTGDARATSYAVGQAEAAGAIPWHHWDPQGGDGAGGWLDVRRWPLLWTDGRGGPPPGTLLQPVPGDTGWALDSAHQPDLSTVPLLLTGRRAFLDEVQAQAAWNVVFQWPAPRGGREANLVRANQVRGVAWSLRQLDDAAWATPQSDPNGEYLRAIAAGNWAWMRAQLPDWTRQQGEAHGWLPGEYGVPGALPPWQQDYFASTAAAAARRGSADAKAVLEWQGNFLAGRFLSRDRGFDPHDGAAYLIAISPENARTVPYSTWAAIGSATRARGLSNAGGWSKTNGDYAQLALQSLAVLADITGSEPARRAYAWLLGAGAPFTRPEDYARDPAFNIVPRGQPRLPARAVRCAG